MAFDAQETEYNTDIIDFLALKVTADFTDKIEVRRLSINILDILWGLSQGRNGRKQGHENCNE